MNPSNLRPINGNDNAVPVFGKRIRLYMHDSGNTAERFAQGVEADPAWRSRFELAIWQKYGVNVSVLDTGIGVDTARGDKRAFFVDYLAAEPPSVDAQGEPIFMPTVVPFVPVAVIALSIALTLGFWLGGELAYSQGWIEHAPSDLIRGGADRVITLAVLGAVVYILWKMRV